MKSLTVALFFLIAASPLFARTWTQAATGRTIVADLVKVEGTQVHLKREDGRIFVVELDSLSEEDREFVKAAPAAAPEAQAAGGQGDWPNFRGPKLDGISPDANLLDSWPDDGPEQVWVFDDAGMGYSGFSVVGGKLFTMGTRGNDCMVICIDTADGSEVWSTRISDDDQQGYNTGWGHGPRSTPSVSEGHVYALGPKGTVACLDADTGKVVWDVDLQNDFGGKAGGWGFSASPLIDGPYIVLAPGGQDAGLVCLDKKEGDIIWKAEEVKPGKAEYATIIPTEIHGVKQYVRLFEKELVGVAAEDGKLLWSSPWEGRTAVIPTPIVRDNEVYITSGYGVGCKLVRINDDFSTEDVWINKEMKNHHGGVVKFGDHLYGFSDGAGLICQDWESGELVWNEKGRFTTKGAVHIADGKLYALNEEDGALTLAEASPDGFEELSRFVFEPQSENRNPKGRIWTHPLVVGGKLYLRDQEYILCYDVSAQ